MPFWQQRFDSELLSKSWAMGTATDSQEMSKSPSSETSRFGPWGSALSLLLFGPLAFNKKSGEDDGRSGGQVPGAAAGWHTWCFYHRDKLTEEGVMPDVASLMQEVHSASWRSSHDSTDLLSTEAAWRLPDLAGSPVPCRQQLE